MVKRLKYDQRHIRVTVTLTRDQRVLNSEDIAQFVEEALGTWGGQKHPDDPLFDSLKVNSIIVGDERFEYE